MKDLIGGSTLGATGIEAMDGMPPANLPCADTAPDDSISRDRLRQLANEIGPRDFAETADLFLMEVEVALDALSTVTAPNLLIDELHFLKGCALNLGMTGMAATCRETIAAVRMGDRLDLPRIKACYRASRSRFLAETCEDFAA